MKYSSLNDIPITGNGSRKYRTNQNQNQNRIAGLSQSEQTIAYTTEPVKICVGKWASRPLSGWAAKWQCSSHCVHTLGWWVHGPFAGQTYRGYYLSVNLSRNLMMVRPCPALVIRGHRLLLVALDDRWRSSDQYAVYIQGLQASIRGHVHNRSDSAQHATIVICLHISS